jgi:integrase
VSTYPRTIVTQEVGVPTSIAPTRVLELKFVTPALAGERFPILLRADGTPCRVALHWVLSRRRRAQASDTLKDAARWIGYLYDAAAHKLSGAPGSIGVDVDTRILRGEGFSTSELDRMLSWVAKRRQDHVAGQILPTSRGARGATMMSQETMNKVVAAWRDFLWWAAEPSNYRPVERLEHTPQVLVERAAVRSGLEAWAEDHLVGLRRRGRRFGLTQGELQAILDVVAPDEDFRFPDTWGVSVRFRNYLMLELARWAGLRRSELLKLQISDIGPASSTDNDPDYAITVSQVRRAFGEPGLDEIRVLRRQDDPYDPRRPEPKVKTAERIIVVPAWLAAMLHHYISEPPPIGRRGRNVHTSYLFVTAAGQPLSTAGADEIPVAVRGPAAGRHQQLYPGITQTLLPADDDGSSERMERVSRAARGGLTWHRFRHTRAKELLVEYAKEGELGLEQFVRYFGWSGMRSAQDYIDDLLADMANETIRATLHNLLRQLPNER